VFGRFDRRMEGFQGPFQQPVRRTHIASEAFFGGSKDLSQDLSPPNKSTKPASRKERPRGRRTLGKAWCGCRRPNPLHPLVGGVFLSGRLGLGSGGPPPPRARMIVSGRRLPVAPSPPPFGAHFFFFFLRFFLLFYFFFFFSSFFFFFFIFFFFSVFFFLLFFFFVFFFISFLFFCGLVVGVVLICFLVGLRFLGGPGGS